jgi:hypothetical protein
VQVQTHTQCVLRRATGSTQVSWIPTKFAQEGRVLELDEDGRANGWTVAEVWGFNMPSKIVFERERDFKNHRKATDV